MAQDVGGYDNQTILTNPEAATRPFRHVTLHLNNEDKEAAGLVECRVGDMYVLMVKAKVSAVHEYEDENGMVDRSITLDVVDVKPMTQERKPVETVMYAEPPRTP